MVKKYSSVTERKIKQAAKEVFLQKGYNWSRTREITEKAWVNLALLNYYFWGKKELFQVVMFESLEDFRDSMFELLDDKNTSFEEKIDWFCTKYYESDMLNAKTLPFVLESIRENLPEVQKKIIKDNTLFTKTVFSQQYLQKTWKTISDFKEFFVNFLWLVVFPIVWAPIITTFFDYNWEQYRDFIKKRKELVIKLIPYLL